MLLNTCSAKLKAELHVVFVDLPRKAVNQLIIGVHTASRVSRIGARLSKKACASRWSGREKKDWQARGMARSRPRRDVTEPDRARIEILVLREESFREAVPAVAQFVQLRRREHVHVRKRNQLDARRGHGIKTRQLATGGIEGQRELLSAIAEEIAPGQNIVLVEVMIDLGDRTRKVVEGGSNRGVVRGKIVF